MAGPTSRYSRDYFCTGQLDADGMFFLSERVPFRYQPFDDTIERIAVAGDTWWSLAFLYYGAIPNAANLLWYVIADFQPVPVVDPTIAIVPGTTVYVPSLQTLLSDICSEQRRKDFTA
jgi:hypothetical protein